jgi:hypothetical protein
MNIQKQPKRMKIVDKNGKGIAIEDLDLAILQADDYRHYRHVGPAFKALEEELLTYWEDIYQKLLRLKGE